MLSAIAAVCLFILMFYDWFGVEFSNQSNLLFYLRGTAQGKNAWEALDYIPVVLLIAVVAALGAAAVRLLEIISKLPTAIDAMVGILGSVSALLILYRIFRPPDFGTVGLLAYEGTLQAPIFLALAAACGIAMGGFLAMLESTSLTGILSRRVPGRVRLHVRGGVR
jgi:hypothetical protein